MSEKNAQKHPQTPPQQQPMKPDPECKYSNEDMPTDGLHLPALISELLAGFIDALSVKPRWDMAPRVRTVDDGWYFVDED